MREVFDVAWTGLTFAQPLWLLGLLALPFLAWRQRRRTRRVGLRVGTVVDARPVRPGAAVRWRGLPTILRYGALALALLALARPQERNVSRTREAEGVDIVLVLDTSTSMRATDLAPNRFEAARDVAADFIRGRTSDRIGLVVFAAKAFTQAPLTLDYAFLQRMLATTDTGVLEDGTAIGSALATAVARLKTSKAASKVVILLTDGQNNRGEVDPLTASEVAQALGVRVYSVGVGAEGASTTVETPFGPRRQPAGEIDEATLQTVAERTGGRYFRATSRTALEGIYDEIGRLETSAVDDRTYTDVAERYAVFLLPALVLLLLERLLAATWLKRFP